MLTLGVGVAVLIASLMLTYIISSKADILFSSGREPTAATYWFTQKRLRPTTTTSTTIATTTTFIPTRHGQFSLKHTTSRYTDRLVSAASRGEGGVGVPFRRRLRVYGLTHVRRDMRTGPDWICLDGSGLIRVIKHTGQAPAGPANGNDVYIFCFRFFLFCFVGFFPFYPKRMFCLLCHGIGTKHWALLWAVCMILKMWMQPCVCEQL